MALRSEAGALTFTSMHMDICLEACVPTTTQPMYYLPVGGSCLLVLALVSPGGYLPRSLHLEKIKYLLFTVFPKISSTSQAPMTFMLS